jgi:hypothetical protein
MHLHNLYLYTFFSCLHNFNSHQIVLEEIGKMAGALLYVHAIVPVNISGLIKTVLNVQRNLETMRAGYKELSKDSSNAVLV